MLSLVISASLRQNLTGGVRVFPSRWFSVALPRLRSPTNDILTLFRFPPLVSVPTVSSLLTDKEKLKFVDVRAPDAYSNRHIPDAVNVHKIFTYLVMGDYDLQGERNKLMTTFEDLFRDAGINGDELVIMYEDSLKTMYGACLLYTSPSPRDATLSRMPSSA